jgi:hypothetical protein
LHAIGLVLDVAAGPPNLGRTVELAVSSSGDLAVVELVGPAHATAKQAANTAAALTLATFVIERDGGAMYCVGDGARFVVKMPLAK